MRFPNQWSGFVYFQVLPLLNLLGIFFLTSAIPKRGPGRLSCSTTHTSVMPPFLRFLASSHKAHNPAQESYILDSEVAISVPESPVGHRGNNSLALKVSAYDSGKDLPPKSQKSQNPPRRPNNSSITRSFRSPNRALIVLASHYASGSDIQRGQVNTAGSIC